MHSCTTFQNALCSSQPNFESYAVATWCKSNILDNLFGAVGNTRLHPIFPPGETSDAELELTVLGGVDERVDTAVGEHQYHGEVVEPEGQEIRENEVPE